MNISECFNASNGSLVPASTCPDPALCEIQSGSNVGLAFGLTIGAGLATTLGALLPFVPFIKRSNSSFLAVGLALATGVMLYVSFTEILRKSRHNFCCVTSEHFDVASTACFFGGIFITMVLDLIVAALQRVDCGCFGHVSAKKYLKIPSLSSLGLCRCLRDRTHCGDMISAVNSMQLDRASKNSGVKEPHLNGLIMTPSNSTVSEPTNSSHEDRDNVVTEVNIIHGETASHGPSITNSNVFPPLNSEQQSQLMGETDSRHCVPVTPDGISVSVNSNTPSDSTNNYATASVNELFSNSSLLRMNAIIPETASLSMAEWGEEGTTREVGEDVVSHVSVPIEEGNGGLTGNGIVHHGTPYQEIVDTNEESSAIVALGPPEFREITEGLGKSMKKLQRMGILTGLAIGLHNFPEGLATFVAALSSPSLGAALAVAIALHNIPEGVCVAMPVYYATGSKWKGFFWAFLSGIFEPLGALLGWLVLKDHFGALVYGITFGLIAGMMVFISLKELLPTAQKFDKTRGKLVSFCLVLGMVIMAVSLILFLY